MDKEKMTHQNEASSLFEPVLHWGALAVKWVALGLGVATLLNLALRGRRLPEAGQFPVYTAAAIAFWIANKEVTRLLDSIQ